MYVYTYVYIYVYINVYYIYIYLYTYIYIHTYLYSLHSLVTCEPIYTSRSRIETPAVIETITYAFIIGGGNHCLMCSCNLLTWPWKLSNAGCKYQTLPNITIRITLNHYTSNHEIIINHQTLTKHQHKNHLKSLYISS